MLKSQYYQRIIHPIGGKDGNCSDIEFKIFNFFRVKRLEQFRPILLSLIHQNELEKLNRERYEASLKFIYNFFVCYTIIGEEKSNKLEDVVFKYARSIELEYSDDLLDEFAKSLKKKLPSFEWFQNAFKNIGWSNHHDLYKGNKNKDRVQLILEVVERYMSQSHSLNDFTIEHILPDSERIENAQIGNLIPLEERLNRRCARMGINKKLGIYCESGFASARGTAQRYCDAFESFQRENIAMADEYLAQMGIGKGNIRLLETAG